MALDNLNDDQKQQIEKAKALPKKKGRPHKEYGQVIKTAAMVLKDSGLSVAQIAQELGSHPTTVARMLRDTSVKIDAKDLQKVRDSFKGTIAEIVAKMLNAANTEEYIYGLTRSRNPGLVEAISKLIEKLNLLEGKPSAITEIWDTAKKIEDKIRELDEMEAALKEATIVPKDKLEN